MARMFPTLVSDPNDRNRRFTGEVGETWPDALRRGYVLCLISAVLMLVIGFALIAAGTPERIDDAVRDPFSRNLRLVAWGNIVLALVLASAAAYFPKGSKTARRVAGATIGLTVFLNLAGFVVGVAGWASFVVVIVLVIALFFMFRPAANAFVDERSGDPWRGVE